MEKNDMGLKLTYFDQFTTFYIIDFNSFWVIHHLSILPYKSTRNQS